MAQTTNPGLDDVDIMPGHISQSNRRSLSMGHIMNNKRAHYTFTLALLLIATVTATAFIYGMLCNTTAVNAVLKLIGG